MAQPEKGRPRGSCSRWSVVKQQGIAPSPSGPSGGLLSARCLHTTDTSGKRWLRESGFSIDLQWLAIGPDNPNGRTIIGCRSGVGWASLDSTISQNRPGDFSHRPDRQQPQPSPALAPAIRVDHYLGSVVPPSLISALHGRPSLLTSLRWQLPHPFRELPSCPGPNSYVPALIKEVLEIRGTDALTDVPANFSGLP